MTKGKKVTVEVEQDSMVDADVLIHAVNVPDLAKIPPEHLSRRRDRHEAARDLIKRLSTVRVSAATWTEFLRWGPAAERAKIEKLASSFDVLAVEETVGQRTAELLHRLVGAPKVCPKCLAQTHHPPSRCEACGANKNPRQHHVDATVAACAMIYRVPVIYTFNVRDFERLRAQVAPSEWGFDVREPPNPNGALFDHASKKGGA